MTDADTFVADESNVAEDPEEFEADEVEDDDDVSNSKNKPGETKNINTFCKYFKPKFHKY